MARQLHKTIRQDGSLDPAADFEDDGASFRMRRQAYLQREYGKRSVWSKPRNEKEAVSQGLLIGLKLWYWLFMFFVGLIGAGLFSCFVLHD